ncbi:dihydrolipoyl dehydrogenase [Alphaproteobacteria bacterium]|jgi:dihydrolipoamide dehydrogenase|nr:dihydrolipoyl dehydrogenase [Alphaproteobacteria bacterium]MBT5799156.1 dihydrolipoyl dehydrogenase [Alphaproteobacteria bacterium]MDA9815851.1 dihydrolipoyl dehydrogenase [Alphaproteobacteria bacterium]
MAAQNYDLIVIGAGPGGYVAAIRAAQLGMNVACIEKRETLGGTCLNVGCIPSKALLNASEKYAEAKQNHLSGLGIGFSDVKLDLKKMLQHKSDIVSGLTTGISQLFAKNKITHLIGAAEIKSQGSVTITSGRDKGVFKAEKILIATGSSPTSLSSLVIDEKQIVSSTGALELPSVPKKLIVVGAGYIGLEMGTVWSRLGAEVEVVDFLPRILPGMDSEIASKFKSILEKQGIKFHLGKGVKEAVKTKSSVTLTLLDSQTEEESKLTCDVALVAVGRKPYIDGLGLEKIGVQLTEKGQIQVDNAFQTNIAGIYAIGDVIEGPMLAHKAEEDGVAAVEIMAGHAGHVDYAFVPGIVYTAPEVATIGKTEEQLKEAGISYSKGVFPFLANSRARATGHTDGMVKLLADKKTDKLLGAHIIGHEAGTIIHEIAIAMSFGSSAEDVARTCHGHPTMNEAVKEAALVIGTGAIHI